mmetsp:Transcript_42460/g.106973  ORF Transcript_42460/g.106973 Transcript_42460/m.106973 type:complete len:96 (+) Transcript_42460:72-359(+)
MIKETRQPAFPGPLYVTGGDGAKRGPIWSDSHLSYPQWEAHPMVSLHSRAFKAKPAVVETMLMGGKSDGGAAAVADYTKEARQKVIGQLADGKAK